jgi:N-acetyl-gamma-glutamyl-phosphate reductase
MATQSQGSLRVGILGATGYTGIELVRLLLQHPKVEISLITSERFAGLKFSDVFPAFRNLCDMKLTELHAKDAARKTTFIFSCLPHQNSMLHVPTLLEYGSKVVDLSADFRIDSAKTFEEWYGPHKAPKLLKDRVYGLPELYREQIKPSFLVANPGCYPTATILGLAPLLKNRLISTKGIICDAKSGTSGAGRTPKQETVFCEVNESMGAYGIDRHRHTPEIEQELSKLADDDLTIRFVPHLIPMDRGLLATIYASPLRKMASEDLLKVYRKFYETEPFVRVLPPGRLPSTKHVRGTNFCDISVHYDDRSGLITVISAIDNLNKGAAGQAIQNMNLMNGFDEDLGLSQTALVP